MQKILDNFNRHVHDVEKLVKLDHDFMKIAIEAVEKLHKQIALVNQNQQSNGARELQILRGIRTNDSLKPRFSLILNQSIVLLVSYFGSAVEDIFCNAISASLRCNSSFRLKKEDMKLTIAELLEMVESSDDVIAELFVEKKDLSFQDMLAIKRAFQEYINVDIEKDSDVNNIILAQACRHVIVHAGGEITPRLLKQVSGASPRDIKDHLDLKEIVQFSQDEVFGVAQSMKRYLNNLVMKTNMALSNIE